MVTVFVFHMCNNFGIHDPNMVSDHYLIYVCIHSCSFVFYRSTFVGSAWSFGFFIPATTANDLRLRRIFYPRFYPLHLISYLSSWERASIFPFECSVLNKGTTGTIFITSLVWRGPWLMIEPETSRTRSQHYTTRLSMEAVLDWRLNPRPPALEASTLPLGYCGGGEHIGKDYENCIRIQTSIPYMYTLDNNKTIDCKCTFGRRHWHHLDTLRQTIAEGI